jgi:hypothetical protein
MSRRSSEAKETNMTRFVTKPVRLLAAVLACCGVVLGLSALPLEAGVCEEAFLICLFEDTLLRMEMPMTYVLFCLEGYAFCKRYIEPASA